MAGLSSLPPKTVGVKYGLQSVHSTVEIPCNKKSMDRASQDINKGIWFLWHSVWNDILKTK